MSENPRDARFHHHDGCLAPASSAGRRLAGVDFAADRISCASPLMSVDVIADGDGGRPMRRQRIGWMRDRKE